MKSLAMAYSMRRRKGKPAPEVESPPDISESDFDSMQMQDGLDPMIESDALTFPESEMIEPEPIDAGPSRKTVLTNLLRSVRAKRREPTESDT